MYFCVFVRKACGASTFLLTPGRVAIIKKCVCGCFNRMLRTLQNVYWHKKPVCMFMGVWRVGEQEGT